MMFRNDVVIFCIISITTLFLSGCGASPENYASSVDQQMSLADRLAYIVGGSIDGDREQAEGFYAAGHLADSVSIGDRGEGYLRIFTGRDTSWTTFDMAKIIQRSSAEVALTYPNREPLQIGDLSSKWGGQLLGHASHQNGLDADIRFFSKNGHVQGPQENGRGFDEIYVKNGRLSDNFDLERNWTLIKSLVSTKRVTRIFMDGVIKNGLCRYAKANGDYFSQTEALRRLRPYPNHRDHLHMRISCPKNSHHCKSQSEEDIGPGTGC